MAMELGGDTKTVLVLAGVMFLWALLLGVLKYQQINRSPEFQAHTYTDIAHRAALLYSFALLLVATFVELSAFSTLVNLLAAGAMAVFFFAAVVSYNVHGLRRDTDNQFRDRAHGTDAFMIALIAGEVGGWLVLFAGFLDGQIL